jgi:histidyl-tRNA synthetase
MSEFKTVRGMRDFLPEEAAKMRFVEAKARKVASLYGYREIITPVVESYELLSAKAGEEVKSRMFVFKDLGGRDVALRPEFTASVARLVATTMRTEPRPLRLFCVGSIYRYDEPQHGRYREFWQSNYELMGSKTPEADAEILMLTDSLMREAGLEKFAIKIGHVGILRGLLNKDKLQENVQNAVMQLMDKKQYDEAFRLVEKAGASQKSLSTLRDLVELKGPHVSEIIKRTEERVADYEESVQAAQELGEILNLVSGTGYNIDITVDAGFARGLEYYTGMIFEVYVPDMEIALGGGGRYDRLIELFGGEPTPAVGVAHGIDRIMLAIKAQKMKEGSKAGITVMVIPTSEELKSAALKLSQTLREAGVQVEIEVMGRKMAKALEHANKRKMDFAIIVGERELKERAVVVRDLTKREQSTVKIERIVDAVNRSS